MTAPGSAARNSPDPASPCDLHSGCLRLALQGLLHLESFELWMTEIKRSGVAVIARSGVRAAELLRPRPGLEVGFARPHGVRGIERMVLGFRPLQQMEFNEASHLVEVT